MAQIRIVPETDDWFGRHKERFDARVRRRAFEIFCRRDRQARTAAGDWGVAKHQLELLPLSGMDENDREIRVSACVAGESCGCDSLITLRVMPRRIVAECGLRFSVLDLPYPIRTDQVRVTLDGDQLSVVAARLNPPMKAARPEPAPAQVGSQP